MTCLAYAAPGGRIYAGSDAATVRVWSVPPPTTGEPAAIVAWAERTTGMTLGGDRGFRPLDPEECRTRAAVEVR